MSTEKTHYAKTQASKRSYRVFYNDELVLESEGAIELSEHYDGRDFAPVIYFPESVVSILRTSESDLSTFCPIKGNARYLGFRDASNCIWCYPEPYPQVGQIKNHYAFDQSKGFRVEATD